MATDKKDEALLALGFSPGFDPSQEQIKDSFRKAAFDFHPDRNPSPDAISKFLKVKKARDYLLSQSDDFDYMEEDTDLDEFGFQNNLAGYKYWWLENFKDF